MTPGLPGIDVDTTVFRQASFLDASIANVSLAVVIGFLLIALILGALLFDWRAALISAGDDPARRSSRRPWSCTSPARRSTRSAPWGS